MKFLCVTRDMKTCKERIKKVLLLKRSRLLKNIRLIAFLNAASHTTCRSPVCGKVYVNHVKLLPWVSR